MLKKGDKVQTIDQENVKNMQGKTYTCASNEFRVLDQSLVYLREMRVPIGVYFLTKVEE
ncbi:hypothetical protein JDS87_20630 [Bacillus cereus]|uniref:hypothetical protein n=1 Tax=Bacillus cereus TaxID=1396 RepID=UPI0018F74AB3|nr:hypothetical protein [Bacillus cereus]MBJ8054285.1 hypothetical protein [Bacillus cereus]